MKKILNLCCTAILTCTLIQHIYASDIQACDPTETCEESSSKEENNFKEISMDDALALFKEKNPRFYSLDTALVRIVNKLAPY